MGRGQRSRSTFLNPFFLLTMTMTPGHVTLRTVWQNVHDPRSGSVTQGHLEKWVQKSCISPEECNVRGISLDMCGNVYCCKGSDQTLPPCNHCHHPWCVGDKSYHKALLIMFSFDGMSDHASWNEVSIIFSKHARYQHKRCCHILN